VYQNADMKQILRSKNCYILLLLKKKQIWVIVGKRATESDKAIANKMAYQLNAGEFNIQSAELAPCASPPHLSVNVNVANFSWSSLNAPPSELPCKEEFATSSNRSASVRSSPAPSLFAHSASSRSLEETNHLLLGVSREEVPVAATPASSLQCEVCAIS
jgi:hypothetical protein